MSNMRETFIFALLIILLSAFLINKEPTQFHVYADESTHYNQAQSIAFDRDLKYTRKDYLRFCKDWQCNPSGIFLKYNGKEFYYGKPFFYSLYLAPFVAIAKGKGVVIANIILALILCSLIYHHFRRSNTNKECLIFLIPALIFSQIIFYTTVVHPDLFEATLLAIAVYLWLGTSFKKETKDDNHLYNRRIYVSSTESLQESPADEPISLHTPNPSQEENCANKIRKSHFWGGKCFWVSIILGIAIYSKPPFTFFYLAFFIYLLKRRWQWAILSLITLLFAWGIPSSIHYFEDGSFSPYTGKRFYCGRYFPYMNSPNELNLDKIGGASHTSLYFPKEKTFVHIFRRTHILIRYLAENIFYYLFGRQTGMVIYQIGGLLCLIMLIIYWRERRQGQVFLFIGLLLYILINFWAVPHNYYGGTTSFGNRYGLHIMGAFFMLAPRLPKSKKVIIPALITLCVGGFFLIPFLPKSYLAVSEHIRNLQKKPLSLMPFERTQLYVFKHHPIFVLNPKPPVKTVLLETPPERNEDKGFFFPANKNYKTLIYFPEDLFKTSFIALNGSNQPLILNMSQAGQKNDLEVPPRSSRYIEIKKYNPDVYWSLTFQIHLVPLLWHSPICWAKDKLCPGSQDMGLYIYQPKEFIRPHKQVEIYPKDSKFDPYLIFGWEKQIDQHPWNNGRWAGIYKTSSVCMYPKGDNKYKLTIRARSPFPEQKVDVYWNDKYLGSFSPKEKSSQFESLVNLEGKKYDEFSILWLEHKIIDLPKKNIPQSCVEDYCTVLYEYIALVPIGDCRTTGWISGSGASDVLLTFKSEDGTIIGTTTSDSRGFYSFYGINSGWSGKTIPSKEGYKFEPEERNYSRQTSNKDNQNFKILKNN